MTKGIFLDQKAAFAAFFVVPLRIISCGMGRMSGMKRPDFLDTNDYTDVQLSDLMNLALALKAAARAEYYPPLLEKRNVCLLLEGVDQYFFNAYKIALHQLGALRIDITAVLAPESLRRTAETLSMLYDALVIKTERHETVLALAKYADIPVINAGTDYCAPMQEIADLVTMYEHLPKEKRLEECKLVYDGPESALCRSMLFLCSKIGMHFAQIADVPGHLKPPVLKIAERNVKRSGGTYGVTESSQEAYRDADFLRTDARPVQAAADGSPHHIDPLENLGPAIRAVLLFSLYRDPATRDPVLIEKMKRTLSIKLHALFGYGLKD